MSSMRVLRVYHGGRSPAHRTRERALVAVGIDVSLVVPEPWTEGDAEEELVDEPFTIFELPVERSGDVNRHAYSGRAALSEIVRTVAS